MAKAPFKGIAQTLQDVLNNLQKQLKEKTLALDEANKKVAALSGGKGGDFTAELDKEKQKRTEAEQAFKDAQKQIAQLKKQVAEGSANGDGTLFWTGGRRVFPAANSNGSPSDAHW